MAPSLSMDTMWKVKTRHPAGGSTPGHVRILLLLLLLLLLNSKNGIFFLLFSEM
jgi:hypothetical protein